MSTKKIQNYLQEYSYLKSIQALLHWDMETTMPNGAIEDRAKRLAYIQGKIHAHVTNKEYEKMIKELEGQKLKRPEARMVKELRHDFNLQKALPENHVKEVVHAQTLANHAWVEARKKNDWNSFRPELQKLIDLKRREASFYKTKKPYDALILPHDKEFNSEKISKLFGELKPGLQEIIKKVKKDGTFVKVKDLKGPFSIEAQKELSGYVKEISNLKAEYSRLDESAHPFSTSISPDDQRITTRYTTKNLDSLSSTMHEVGHALYEFNLPRKWEGTPLQEAISFSVHESQSRFWENIVGRSREFSYHLHPRMKKLFPKSMNGVTPEGLYQYFNKSTPGMIRVESCELYYDLHIIIRYEIEEMIFNEGLKASDIPKIWNEKYKEYLGLSPKNYAEGVLQDSHWAGAAFGYFPTYSLGNLILGSLYQKLKKEVPHFRKDIRKGDLTSVGSFLKKNVHLKGRLVNAEEIVGEINVKDYLSYLNEKFGDN